MMPRIENSREPNTKKYISRVYPQFIFWSEPILLLRAFNYENDVLPIVLIQPTLIIRHKVDTRGTKTKICWFVICHGERKQEKKVLFHN